MRILLVEDEFVVALDLQATLEDWGHAVTGPVGTLGEAEALAREASPAVAVARALPTAEERWKGLRFAARMAWKDGELQDEERSFLALPGVDYEIRVVAMRPIGGGEAGATARIIFTDAGRVRTPAITRFDYDAAVPATQAGLWPDAISTDLHTGSMNDGMKNMTNVMSKMMEIGREHV